MQYLQILTKNNYGSTFWEKHAGMHNAIQFSALNFSSFKNLVDQQNEFILVDFYNSKLCDRHEQELIDQLSEYLNEVSNNLKLFILSPSYAGSKLEKIQLDNVHITTHNFTAQFLRSLSLTGRKISFINKKRLERA